MKCDNPFEDNLYVQQETPSRILQTAIDRKKHHIRTTLGRTNFKEHFEQFYTSDALKITFKLSDDVANALNSCSGEDISEALGPICKISGERCFFLFEQNCFIIKRTNYELDACMSACSQKEVYHETGNRTSWSDFNTFIDLVFIHDIQSQPNPLTIATLVTEFEFQKISFLKDIFLKTNATTLLLAFIQSSDTYGEAQLAPDVYEEITENNAMIDKYICAALECPAPYQVGHDEFVLIFKKKKTTKGVSFKKYTTACVVLSILAPILLLFFVVTFFIAIFVTSIIVFTVWALCFSFVAVVFSVLSLKCCGKVHDAEALQKIPVIAYVSQV